MAKFHRQNSIRKVRESSENTVLCTRDLQILSLIFENKVMSRKQIGDIFFPNVSKDTVNRRLRKITNLGLITRKPIELGINIFRSYSLTPKGLAKIKPLLPYDVQGVQVASECPLHDIALNDIRQAFEAKTTVQSYYTENVLQACDDFKSDEQFEPFIALNSDAMVEVDSKVGLLNLAIEFDMIHKSKDRYRQKVNAYYVKHGIDGVLYVCASKHILNRLLKIDKTVADNYRCGHKLYFALLENITGAMGELTFTNARRGIFNVS